MLLQAVELWLALARQKNFQDARQFLHEAWHVLPSEKAIYLYAAKLEEAHVGFLVQFPQVSVVCMHDPSGYVSPAELAVGS